jgi:hypothetical protein
VNPTAISAVVPRRRASVAGRITRVRQFRRPWVRFDVELSDGTGTLILRFMGRSRVPGMESGRYVAAEGTPALEHGVLIVRNPRYTFRPARCQSG